MLKKLQKFMGLLDIISKKAGINEISRRITTALTKIKVYFSSLHDKNNFSRFVSQFIRVSVRC